METRRKYTEEELYGIAKERVQLKREFLTHFVIYITVNLFLAFINLYTSSGYLWFLWPTFGWGIGIAAHGIDTYTKLNLDQSAIEKEVEKLKSRGL